MTITITTPTLTIDVTGSAESCWAYRLGGREPGLPVAAPRFELDGQPIIAAFTPSGHHEQALAAGVVEHRIDGGLLDRPDLNLQLTLRVAPTDPIVRFRYELRGDATMTCAERAGGGITYLTLPLAADDQLIEVRLSEFDELAHTFRPSQRRLPNRDAAAGPDVAGSNLAGIDAMGPILAVEGSGSSFVLAYEHGSQAPDAFVSFACTADWLALRSVHGTYLHGQSLPYQTVWCHLGAVDGGLDRLAAAYRRFILEHQSTHPDSRQPYLFYNTWAMQEREKWWHGGHYLDPMHDQRILAEIDAAHRIGIEVFVLDTGWYVKTGDWQVNTHRFGHQLAAVKARLDGYGMALGLWFGPMDAAVSSVGVRDHPEYQVSWHGQRRPPRPVWETEASNRMCVVSGYGDQLADRLIELGTSLGVTYYKWDAIDQYGCDDPGHGHGDDRHSPTERAEHYAYRLPLRLAEIAERICAGVPGAIVDFDVTEHRRSLGLAFLAAGKYFLINNGPYHSSFDQPDEPGRNPNVFFYPGSARAQVARTPLGYDSWIPSTLFLTHYLPDDPADSQLINIASVVLGQNGIWGDLQAVSDPGVALMAELLSQYKRVRDDMAAAAAVRTGAVGGSPEVHEKLSPTTGRGAVVVFSPVAGSYEYLTDRHPDRQVWTTEGVTVAFAADGRARVRSIFDRPGARIAFFG